MRCRADTAAGLRAFSFESYRGAMGWVTAFWQRKKTSLMLWWSLALVRMQESISLNSFMTGSISSDTTCDVVPFEAISDLFAHSTTGTLTPRERKYGIQNKATLS